MALFIPRLGLNFRKIALMSTCLAMAFPILIGTAKAGDFLVIGGATKKPYAHHVYCQSRPSDCRKNRAAKPEILSASKLKKLQSINVAVNQWIKPMDDKITTGKTDVWTYPTRQGDCEDFAIAKRKKLISAGFKPANLRFTVVKQRNGQGHLVLTVRTNQGDFVLDNLRNDVRKWNKTGYRFVKIQDGERPREWLRIV